MDFKIWVTAVFCSVSSLIVSRYWTIPHAKEKAFTEGCLAADPSRVVLEINGKQRCLTQDQAKAVGK